MIHQIFILTFAGFALCAPSNKVDGRLQKVLLAKRTANIVVSFSHTDAVLYRVDSMRFVNRGAKIAFMKSQLEDLQAATQKNALNLLRSRSMVHYESLWINNRIYIKNASADLIQALADLDEVTEVREETVIRLEELVQVENNTVNAEWGIDKIEAQEAWSLPGGNNGQGVVVGSIDSGVRYTHEALRDNYRSSYGWYDPYEKTATPNDATGHGTHTIGSAVGSNGIGVAPGAQWIACKGCSGITCSESALSACGQWILCPTNTDGESPNCNMAPPIVSNSWGGGQGSSWYDPIINSWHSAGIIPLFAMGNSGPYCDTAESPGDNPNVIAVGATTSRDGIATLSSRGLTVTGAIKPDIAAPGDEIRSAWHTGDNDYHTTSGTSMACPHAAGLTALLLARNPNLTFMQVKDLLQNNCDRSLGLTTACGGIPPTTFPNNIYGYGRINARRSLAAAINSF